VKWTNSWIEDAQNSSVKRILLIGDSVTRQYRGSLNQLVQGKGFVVDFLAGSYGIFDKRFENEIIHFFKQSKYRYEIIIYSDIHHGFEVRVVEDENRIKYKEKLMEVIDILGRLGGKISIYICLQ
jgi:gluconate kinase